MQLQLPTDDDYAECVHTSERVSWKIDDVLPPHRELDFSRPFLPEALVHLADAPLPAEHKLAFNHIRAHSYVNLFIFVEEFIIATAMRHANAEQFGSVPAMRALLRFADEELKHQEMFHRFREAFRRGFHHECEVLDNAVEVAGYILTKPAASVMLVTLHLELITQQHYVNAIKVSAEELEPSFRRMFESHWIEESQHARIDALELAKITAHMGPEARLGILTDYEELLHSLDALLAKQAEMDVRTLERMAKLELADGQRRDLLAQQQRSYRRDFLLDGFDNAALVRMVQRLLGADGTARLAAIADRFR